MDNNQTRKVSLLLGVGIFIIPIVFAWFTLRKGYSTTSRVLSFGWLLAGVVAFAMLPDTHVVESNVKENKVESVAKTEAKETVAVKNIKENISKNKEVKEVKEKIQVEPSLGLTPEQFRTKFNARLKELNLTTINTLSRFDVKKGDVRDVFQVNISKSVSMVGSVNKDGMLHSVTYIMGKTEEGDNAALAMLVISGVTANVVSHDNKEASQIVVDLLNKAVEGFGKDGNSYNKTVGNVKYFSSANNMTGLWFGVEPKEKS